MDVFVSYKAEDRRRVRPLVEALEADGFSVWWDEQIGGGDEWRRSIEAHLDEAHCVIVVWSRRSIGAKGQFVRDEAMRAQRRGTYLPVRIDRVEPPLGFGERQAIDLVRWNGDPDDQGFQAVVAAVRAICAGQAPAPFAGRGSVRASRRTVLAGTGVMVAAAAASGWFLLRPRPAEASDSIAVLPFDNLSGDPAQGYFSDGMAEELRSALTRIAELKVVARTSSEAVRSDDAKTAARKLGVANILMGSIRRSPTTIRISAQLIDGSSGIERWSQDFDQPIGDTLTIQTDIAERVAEALTIQLGGAARAALVLGGTSNLAAQDLFLKAAGTTDDSLAAYQRSIAELDAATQLDPGYARAFARKATSTALLASQYARSSAELAADLDSALAAAKRAIALAPRLAQTHSALGLVYKLQLKFKEALPEMEAGTRLAGADADTFGRYAIFLAQIGRPAEAQRAVAHAISSDPLNPRAFEQQLMVLYLAHLYEPAITAAHRSLELAPSVSFVRWILGNVLVMMGRYKDALENLSGLDPAGWEALTVRSIVAARAHDQRTFGDCIERLRSNWGDSSNYEFAQIYAQRGDADTAIGYLRKPVMQRDPGFIFIKSDPLLDPIRGDPRFKEIIAGMDFPS